MIQPSGAFLLRGVLGLDTNLCRRDNQRIVPQRQRRDALVSFGPRESEAGEEVLQTGNVVCKGHNLCNLLR